jgi:hypothetical protein
MTSKGATMAVQITVTDIYATRITHTTLTDGVAEFDVTDRRRVHATVTGAATITRTHRGAKTWRPEAVIVEYSSHNGAPWDASTPRLHGHYTKKDGTAGQLATGLSMWTGDPDTPAWVDRFVADNLPEYGP